jgi:hypothetical protein
MNRPVVELADIVGAIGDDFIDRHRSSLTWPQLKALLAIRRCRTAALGGHLDDCSQCGHQAISYNSCRNRHCPRCQTSARNRWLAERTKELLPVAYSHVVFTLPQQLAMLAQQNKRVLYDLLLRTSAATLLEIAADPRHLGAKIGFLSVLHTWGQNLKHHPHVHCVVPTGGLAFDESCWIRPQDGFFLPVKVLSKVFRGKFVAGLRRAFRLRKVVVPRRAEGVVKSALISCIRPVFVPKRLGGLLEETLSWARARPATPFTLHTPGRYLKPSSVVLQRRSDYLPMEGLRSRQ